MAESADISRDAGKVPPPRPLAMVVCDSIHRDPGTGKFFLLGTFSTILAQKFPAKHALMALYVSLTNGRGKVPFRLVLVDVDEERDPILERAGEIEFSDPRLIMECCFVMNGIVFPMPGEYRFQFFACDEFLMERRLVVLQVGEGHSDD